MTWRQLNYIDLLRYAGLFTYVCVGTPLLRYQFLLEEAVRQQRPVGYLQFWLICYLSFGLVFWFLTHDFSRGHSSLSQRLLRLVLLLALNAMAIAIGYFSQSGLCALLLVVIAVILPWLLPLPVGLAWLVIQNFSLVPLFASFPGWEYSDAFLQSSLYLGFSTLTFVTSLIAKQQAGAREDLRRLNAELRATRALLAESSRINERMRIARELHDLVGHHLTALSLNLEVATHQTQGQALEHVRQAQSVAKLLLADVREVVSQLREEDSIDLTQALHDLTEGVPGLDIHLELPTRFALDDPKRAQVLLRCTQEIITNTVRHAGAQTLWLVFERTDDNRLLIRARDDGRGVAELKRGHGLTGMQERLAAFGGRLDIATGHSGGFALEIHLPLRTSD